MTTHSFSWFLTFLQVLSERTMKDAEILNSRLNKLSAEYENQLMSADVLAQENQSKVAELKVKPHMTL